MNKKILEIVEDFSSWRGNSFTLAVLVAEAVKDACVEAIEPEHPAAAQTIREL